MLERKKILEKIEVNSLGIIFLKEIDQISDDGVVVSSVPHRTSYAPGDDVLGAIQQVKNIAQIFWTPEIISNYKKLIE